MAYHDDNFGTWDIEDEETRKFYHQVQRESVRKRCQGCGRIVNLRPQYAYCNGCTEKIENGLDVG